MSVSDITSIFQTIFAGIGMIVTVIGGGYAAYRIVRSRKPQLKAELINGFLTFGPELSDVMLFFKIANPSDKPSMITSVDVRWNKRTIIFPKIDGEREFPFQLAPSEGISFWTPLKDLAQSIREGGGTGKIYIKARFRDAVGNEYYSRRFSIDLNDWKEASG